MSTKRKAELPEKILPIGIALGTVAALIVTMLGAALLSWLISTEKIAQQGMGYGVMIIIFLASAAGAAIAVRLVGRQRMIVCLVVAAAYFLLLLSVTALFFDGQYQGVGVTGLLMLGGSLFVGLLGLRGDNKRAGKKHKIRNR